MRYVYAPSSATTDAPTVDKYTVSCSPVLGQVLFRGSTRAGYGSNGSIKNDGIGTKKMASGATIRVCVLEGQFAQLSNLGFPVSII